MKKMEMGVTGFLLVILMVIALIPFGSFPSYAKEGENENQTEENLLTESNYQVGDIIKFGHYEQDGDETNGKEEIEWQVLKVESDRLMVISKYALDCKQYNSVKTDITWENCSLRKWLNNDFKNAAFTTDEQQKILSVTLKNNDNKGYGTSGGNDTNDQIFCLSLDEAESLFGAYTWYSDENSFYGFNPNLFCEPTQYTVNNGAFVFTITEDYYYDEEDGLVNFGYSTEFIGRKGICWWLRTPGVDSKNTCDVSAAGNAGATMCRVVNIQTFTVRPAMYINKDADICKIVESGIFENNKQAFWSVSEDGILRIYGEGEMDDYLSNIFYSPSSSAPWLKYNHIITKVVVEEGITKLGICAFYKLNKVASVQLPKSLQTIGANAFRECTSLKSITIPQKVCEINETGPFFKCPNLEQILVDSQNDDFVSVDGVLYTKNMDALVCYPAKKSCEIYRIPETVNKLYGGAFSSVTSMNALVIPEGVDNIGWHVFEDCDNLDELELPTSLKTIGQESFKHVIIITDVYYRGTREQWLNVSGNNYIKYNYIHYNSSIDNEITKQIRYAGRTMTFDPTCLTQGATTDYNKELSKVCALLNQAAYSDNGEDVKSIFDQMGIHNYDNDYTMLGVDGPIFCYSVGCDTMNIGGVDTNVVVFVLRGTNTLIGEGWRDLTTTPEYTINGYPLYDVVKEYSENVKYAKGSNGVFLKGSNEVLINELPDIWKISVNNSKPTKIIITGHSLGGATANYIGALVNNSVKYNPGYSKDDVFVYTYASIDSISKDALDGGSLTSGYENIHNVYNYYDSYGPNGWVGLLTANGSSGYGKFGHIDIFSYNVDPEESWKICWDNNKNHMMDSVYIPAIFEEIDGVWVEHDTNRRVVSVHCPVDVNVYKDDELVVRVKDNKVERNLLIIPTKVIGDEKYFLIDSNVDYRFEMVATGDGAMEFNISDVATGIDSKTFDEVKLEPGKKMISEIEAEEEASDVQLFVVDDSGKVISEVNVDGEEVPVKSVPESIQLDKTTATMATGEKLLLTATLTPEDVTESAIIWMSSNPDVASVEDGIVTARSSGVTTITAKTVNGLTAECEIIVQIDNNPENIFADIKFDSWQYRAVRPVYDKGYMTGKGMIGDKIWFAPNDGINRSQFAVALYSIAGKPEVTYEQKFSDVKEGAWYANAVTWAEQKGIVAGNADGTFGINGKATREQMALMFYKYAVYCKYNVDVDSEVSLETFTDADTVHDWALTAVKWAVSRGIISGKGNAESGYRIDPTAGATRAECAAMMNKFSQLYDDSLSMIIEDVEEPISLPEEEDAKDDAVPEDDTEDVIDDEDNIDDEDHTDDEDSSDEDETDDDKPESEEDSNPQPPEDIEE